MFERDSTLEHLNGRDRSAHSSVERLNCLIIRPVWLSNPRTIHSIRMFATRIGECLDVRRTNVRTIHLIRMFATRIGECSDVRRANVRTIRLIRMFATRMGERSDVRRANSLRMNKGSNDRSFTRFTLRATHTLA